MQQFAQGRLGIGLVHGDAQHPGRALDAGSVNELRGAAHVHFGVAPGLGQPCHERCRQRRGDGGGGFQHQLGIGVGQDVAGVVQQEGKALVRGADAIDLAGHAVQVHIGADDRHQAAGLGHRLGKGNGQLAGGGIHVGRGHDGLVSGGSFLVPGACGADVAIRHGVGKDVRAVGIDEVGIVKIPGLLGRQQEGHGFVFAHGLLDGAGDALLFAHPFGQFGGVQMGELADALVERLLGILAHGKKGG